MCPLPACESIFLLGARQHAEVDELLAVLVTDAEVGGRAILEIEMNSPHAVVDPATDAGGGEVVSVATFFAPPFGLG